jgi:fumarylacetoacetase
VTDANDPSLVSWVESAQDPASDFPVQNLPFGVFRRAGSDEMPRPGVAIGDQVLDLSACFAEGMLAEVADTPAALACALPSLNGLMALGRAQVTALRQRVSETLRAGASPTRYDRERAARILVPQAEAELFVPAEVGDYTDFYASVHHAARVGALFRPDQPLLPNYKWVPIGYHGRASSLVPSGAAVRRPSGQRKGPADAAPSFGPSRMLDYELELGAFVGPGTPLGGRLDAAEAEAHLFGLCLVNDWSARDLQAWEYQPLGPFLAKSFATTVAPWVVTLDALEPFRAPAAARPEGDPAPLPYLHAPVDQARGAFDVTVEAWLRTPAMREAGAPAVRLSRGSFRDMYWTWRSCSRTTRATAATSARRPARQRDDLGGGGRGARLPAGDHPAGGGAGAAAGRVGARVLGGRGRGGAPGLLRPGGRAADRVRGVPRGGDRVAAPPVGGGRGCRRPRHGPSARPWHGRCPRLRPHPRSRSPDMPNDSHSSSADQADRTPAVDRNRAQADDARHAHHLHDAEQSRDRYRDNDDARGYAEGDARNQPHADSRGEARGDAREAVGNNARGTDAHPTGPGGNDKQKGRSDLPDAFDDDLARDNRRGREPQGMGALASDTRAGLAGAEGAHGSFGHDGVQHDRKTQAASPAERGHDEQPRDKEGHGR